MKSELQQICDKTLKDKTKLKRKGGVPVPTLYTSAMCVALIVAFPVKFDFTGSLSVK